MMLRSLPLRPRRCLLTFDRRAPMLDSPTVMKANDIDCLARDSDSTLTSDSPEQTDSNPVGACDQIGNLDLQVAAEPPPRVLHDFGETPWATDRLASQSLMVEIVRCNQLIDSEQVTGGEGADYAAHLRFRVSSAHRLTSARIYRISDELVDLLELAVVEAPEASTSAPLRFGLCALVYVLRQL